MSKYDIKALNDNKSKFIEAGKKMGLESSLLGGKIINEILIFNLIKVKRIIDNKINFNSANNTSITFFAFLPKKNDFRKLMCKVFIGGHGTS